MHGCVCVKKKELQLSYFSNCEGKKINVKISELIALKAGSTVGLEKPLLKAYIMTSDCSICTAPAKHKSCKPHTKKNIVSNSRESGIESIHVETLYSTIHIPGYTCKC